MINYEELMNDMNESKGAGKMINEESKYEELMNKSDECCLKAIDYAKKGDWNMATFYKNASIGFKEKALKLNVGC